MKVLHKEKGVTRNDEDCWRPDRRRPRSYGERQFGHLRERKKSRWIGKTGRLRHGDETWTERGTRRNPSSTGGAAFPIEKRFFELAKAWKNQTAGYSLAGKKITNANYMDIIGMGVTLGNPVIKLILRDLQKGPEFWHFALKSITKQNPVPKENINDLRKVREAWLDWGEQNNLL